MTTYYLNEAAFTLPDRGFVDLTLHRLESPLAGEDPLAIEIRRLPMDAGKSLRALVDEEVTSTKTRVDGFTIVEDGEVSLGGNGAPAIVLRARMRARDQLYVQRQAHVAFEDTWIAFIVTSPSTERVACDETFDRILHSIDWRTA
ncbi:MAG: DcrB-related protein [Myxococcales bacterium]|nr:DcrB-related protein [Myxococcales bacterium]